MAVQIIILAEVFARTLLILKPVLVLAKVRGFIKTTLLFRRKMNFLTPSKTSLVVILLIPASPFVINLKTMMNVTRLPKNTMLLAVM